MRFRWTVIVSLLAHVGLFSLVYLKPADRMKGAMTYYVDLVSMPGGGDGRPAGGGRGPGAKAQPGGERSAPVQTAKVRDLTVAKGEEPAESQLRFPDGRKKTAAGSKPPKEKEKMVTVVTRREKTPEPTAVQDKKSSDSAQDSFLRIGVAGEGSGNGQGTGTGDGVGDGTGLGLGFGTGAPGGYNYYYAALQNKIKNSWFNTAFVKADAGRIAYIACRIDRSGQVADVRVYQSSGDEALDNSGLRAVRRAAPFPPFPAGNPNRYIDVIFEFEGRKR